MNDKKWQEQYNKKKHWEKLNKIKSTLPKSVKAKNSNKIKKKKVIDNSNSILDSANTNSDFTLDEKQNLDQIPLYMHLKNKGLQQYTKELVSRGYGYYLDGLCYLEKDDLVNLFDSIKVLPGHKKKFKDLVKDLKRDFLYKNNFNKEIEKSSNKNKNEIKNKIKNVTSRLTSAYNNKKNIEIENKKRVKTGVNKIRKNFYNNNNNINKNSYNDEDDLLNTEELSKEQNEILNDLFFNNEIIENEDKNKNIFKKKKFVNSNINNSHIKEQILYKADEGILNDISDYDSYNKERGKLINDSENFNEEEEEINDDIDIDISDEEDDEIEDETEKYSNNNDDDNINNENNIDNSDNNIDNSDKEDDNEDNNDEKYLSYENHITNNNNNIFTNLEIKKKELSTTKKSIESDQENENIKEFNENLIEDNLIKRMKEVLFNKKTKELNINDINNMYKSFNNGKITSTLLNMDIEEIINCLTLYYISNIKQGNELFLKEEIKDELFESTIKPISDDYIYNTDDNEDISKDDVVDEIIQEGNQFMINKTKEINCNNMINMPIIEERSEITNTELDQSKSMSNQNLRSVTQLNISIGSKYNYILNNDEKIKIDNFNLFLKAFKDKKNNNSINNNLEVPSYKDIYNYIKNIYISSKLEPETLLISSLYLEKIKNKDYYINSQIWKKLILSLFILASKVWDDTSLETDSFLKLFPSIKLKDLNEMERVLLEILDYKILIDYYDYTKFYFNLKEKFKVKKHSNNLKPLDIDTVINLQNNKGIRLKEVFKDPKYKSFK